MFPAQSPQVWLDLLGIKSLEKYTLESLPAYTMVIHLHPEYDAHVENRCCVTSGNRSETN
jgi:hypothetical protein